MNKTIVPLAACLLLACGSALCADIKSEPACAPGISFWSLLGEIGIGFADPHLQVEKLYAICLPQPKSAGDSNFAYGPEQGGKLAMAIQSADGAAFGTYVWSAESVGGLWELSNYKVLGGHEALKPLAPGRYTLEFQIDGAPFYRFPFSVSSLPGDDPYQAAGLRWFIDGAWNDYGNVFYQRNDPQSTFRFTSWVRDKVGHAQPRSAPYSAQLVRSEDGKVIGEDNGTARLTPQWAQFDVYFQQGANAGEKVKAADVLAQDGEYRVRVSIDGKPYGLYPFAVHGGKIDVQAQQSGRTPPAERIVDYLYGGKYRSWWIRREEADAKLAN